MASQKFFWRQIGTRRASHQPTSQARIEDPDSKPVPPVHFGEPPASLFTTTQLPCDICGKELLHVQVLLAVLKSSTYCIFSSELHILFTFSPVSVPLPLLWCENVQESQRNQRTNTAEPAHLASHHWIKVKTIWKTIIVSAKENKANYKSMTDHVKKGRHYTTFASFYCHKNVFNRWLQ